MVPRCSRRVINYVPFRHRFVRPNLGLGCKPIKRVLEKDNSVFKVMLYVDIFCGSPAILKENVKKEYPKFRLISVLGVSCYLRTNFTISIILFFVCWLTVINNSYSYFHKCV